MEWLIARESKQSLHCFYCLLFGEDDNKWSRIGFKDLSHINQSIKKHESSKVHINSAVKYQTFGVVDIASQIDAGYRLATSRYFEHKVSVIIHNFSYPAWRIA